MGKLYGEKGRYSFYKVFSLLEYGVVLKRTLDVICDGSGLFLGGRLAALFSRDLSG